MGNNIGGRIRKAKIMNINGEVFKLRMPAVTGDVIKDYPGHVLLESEAVKKYGIRAKPLELEEELEAKKVYFLVELPKMPEENIGIDKENWIRLRQGLVYDVSVGRRGSVRVKIRVPKAQVERLIQESKDDQEVAEKIIHLCLQNSSKEMEE